MRSIYRRVSATGNATSVIRLPGQIHSLTNLTSQPLPSLKSVGISFANSGSCEATRGFSLCIHEVRAASGKTTCPIELREQVQIGGPDRQKSYISALFQDSSVGRAHGLRSGRVGRELSSRRRKRHDEIVPHIVEHDFIVLIHLHRAQLIPHVHLPRVHLTSSRLGSLRSMSSISRLPLGHLIPNMIPRSD